MSKNPDLSISVIVPVYNESANIEHCLLALREQTVLPDETIVIDNNCTDDTIEKAKKCNFVRVIKEPKQGMSPARNAGVANAHGDIILSIDGDTALRKDYIESLHKLFSDPGLGAVTGFIESRFEIIPKSSYVLNWLYYAFTEAFFGHKVLFGSNMAFRSKYWKEIKGLLINDDTKIHEDQDLSLALASIGVKSEHGRSLRASVMMEKIQRAEVLIEYTVRLISTKRSDRAHSRYKLPTRLKKSRFTKRLFLGLFSVVPLLFFGVFTLAYSIFLKLKKATS